MAYTTHTKVKEELNIGEETWDTFIDSLIPRGDAWADGELKRHGLVVPSPTPVRVEEACTYYVASLFREIQGAMDETPRYLNRAKEVIQEYVEAESQGVFKAA